MKRLLVLVVLLLTSMGIYANPKSRDLIAYRLSYSLCDSPIAYRIDTVDPKFNLSREEFAFDVDQATKIWEVPSGKDLFVFDSKGELSINLIFDERQSLTNQINQLEGEVKTNQQNLTPQISEYKKQSSELEVKLQEFKKEVSYWNSKGGAPEDVYNRLIQNQKDLQE